ncbi:MAG: hypothetical protein IKW88_05995 [Clostridiales bacterium]|nr:hypothetical protein [Clostridiales bacterium]
MNLIKQHKTTSIFVFLLIIAGILNLLTKTSNSLVNTVMFCANFMIYIGLIVFWAHTVRDRILPTRTRSYMLASSVFMIVYMLQRVFRYRAVISSLFVYRSMAYVYYIPLVMIPSLLLATAVNLGLGNKRIGRRVEKIIIVSSGVVSAIALTNDLHHLVYVPKVALSEFNMDNNSYSWGIGFYIIYAWLIFALVSGALILFSIVGKNGKKPIILLAVTVVTWIALCAIHALVFERYSISRPYFKPEIDCFSMILIFECCIRSRLIPHNENYKGFFEKLKLPILITDNDLNAVHTSNKSLNVSVEDFEKAKAEPCYPEKDIRLSSMKIRAGYAFWTENEHELQEQRKRLKEANELLSEENDLIAVENKLKEQKAHIEAQNQVYERITAAIYPKQKSVESILKNVDPDTDAFAEALGKVCVFNAYSKRKSNLLLLSEDNLPKSNRELFLALAETCRYLKCCGIDAAAVGEEYSSLPLKAVNKLYDTFEAVIETYLGSAARMTVSILPNGVRIAMETSKEQKLPETVLPVKSKESDGLLFLTILNEAEEKAV